MLKSSLPKPNKSNKPSFSKLGLIIIITTTTTTTMQRTNVNI